MQTLGAPRHCLQLLLLKSSHTRGVRAPAHGVDEADKFRLPCTNKKRTLFAQRHTVRGKIRGTICRGERDFPRQIKDGDGMLRANFYKLIGEFLVRRIHLRIKWHAIGRKEEKRTRRRLRADELNRLTEVFRALLLRCTRYQPLGCPNGNHIVRLARSKHPLKLRIEVAALRCGQNRIGVNGTRCRLYPMRNRHLSGRRKRRRTTHQCQTDIVRFRGE